MGVNFLSCLLPNASPQRRRVVPSVAGVCSGAPVVLPRALCRPSVGLASSSGGIHSTLFLRQTATELPTRRWYPMALDTASHRASPTSLACSALGASRNPEFFVMLRLPKIEPTAVHHVLQEHGRERLWPPIRVHLGLSCQRPTSVWLKESTNVES